MTKSRRDFEFNHLVIRKAYLELLNSYKRKPTLSEISKKTKLSLKTIDRHLGEMKFDPQATSLRVLTDDVLVSIFQSAKKGNVAAQKLWLSVLEGWTEKTMLSFNDGTGDPYLYRSMTEEELDQRLIDHYTNKYSVKKNNDEKA